MAKPKKHGHLPAAFVATFRYEIGGLVFFRAAQHTAGHRPKRFCVIGRIAEERAGGIEMFYRLEEWRHPVPAVALTCEEPPFRPRCVADLAEVLQIDAARAEQMQ